TLARRFWRSRKAESTALEFGMAGRTFCGSFGCYQVLQIQTVRQYPNTCWRHAILKYLLPEIPIGLTAENGLSELGIDPARKIADISEHRFDIGPNGFWQQIVHQSVFVNHLSVEGKIVLDRQADPLENIGQHFLACDSPGTEMWEGHLLALQKTVFTFSTLNFGVPLPNKTDVCE